MLLFSFVSQYRGKCVTMLSRLNRFDQFDGTLAALATFWQHCASWCCQVRSHVRLALSRWCRVELENQEFRFFQVLNFI